VERNLLLAPGLVVDLQPLDDPEHARVGKPWRWRVIESVQRLAVFVLVHEDIKRKLHYLHDTAINALLDGDLDVEQFATELGVSTE
jgi:hypothetical protein